VTLLDQSPHQLEKARKKPDLQGVTILEVRGFPSTPKHVDLLAQVFPTGA